MKKFSILLIFLTLFFYEAGESYASINYDLAYPGMLPDNPLYKIKVLRNKLEDALISDPNTKIKFYLLQADKGMLATAILVDKNEIKLADETALKAENNMTLISNESKRVKKLDSELLKKLETASLKHQEVLVSLIKRVPDNDKRTLEVVLDFSKRNIENIKKNQSKKYLND